MHEHGYRCLVSLLVLGACGPKAIGLPEPATTSEDDEQEREAESGASWTTASTVTASDEDSNEDPSPLDLAVTTAADSYGDPTDAPEPVPCTDDQPGDTGMAAIDVAAEFLVDDFEDGDGTLADIAGRSGSWYAYSDETAPMCPAVGVAFLPVPGGPHESAYAAAFSGEGFSVWGGGIAVDFDGPTGIAQPLDASAFQGLVFQARGHGLFRVQIPTRETTSIARGGTCVGKTSCDDHYGLEFSVQQDGWQQLVIDFDAVEQQGWGTTVSFESTHVLGLQWQIFTGVPFEIGLDDIAFRPR